MQRGRNVIRTRSGCPPLEINNDVNKNLHSTGGFSVDRCITYTMGERLLSLGITEVGYTDRVNAVCLNVTEENGMGSSANLNLHVMKDDEYGFLCHTSSILKGSFDMMKENCCMPTMPDTQLICYACRETGLGSVFTLEKKKSNIMETVEKVKATHAFLIDDELTCNVNIKITKDIRGGLRVEVEGPIKHTRDYTNRIVSTMRGRNISEREARMKDAMRIGGIRDGVNRLTIQGNANIEGTVPRVYY